MSTNTATRSEASSEVMGALTPAEQLKRFRDTVGRLAAGDVRKAEAGRPGDGKPSSEGRA